MINFRNPKAARFAVTIFSMGVVALSLPASAGGHGGGGVRTWVAAVAKGVLPTGRPILRRLLSSPAARQAGQLAATVSNLSSTRMALVVAYRRIKGCK
jgi:hypothetical protein